MRGCFITFEGIEGVGKTTQVAFLKKQLEHKKLTVIVTREPGGTPLAEQCRDLLLQSWDESVTSETEVLLLFAARSQHIQNVILPALERGDWVISDRFTDATYAYQGSGRGIPSEIILPLEKIVQKGLQPDLTLLLDAPVSVGQQRVLDRSQALDRIEQEKADFFERVRTGYLQLAKEHPDRYHIIDAEKNIQRVQENILQAVQPLFKLLLENNIEQKK